VIVRDRPHGAQLFFVIRGSVLPHIAWELVTCTAVAVLVTLTHGFIYQWKVTLTTVPFSLIGLALAIFLGFRNNAAYDRYWEARKLWAEVEFRARSFARQVQTLTHLEAAAGPADQEDPRHGLVMRTIAFASALRHQLRGSDPLPDMRRLLSTADAAGFISSLRRTCPSAASNSIVFPDSGTCTGIFGGLDEGLGLAARAHLAAHGAYLVGMARGSPISRLHQLVHHEGGFRRAGGEAVADVHHGQLGLVQVAHHALLVGGDAGVAREVGDQAVAEAQHVAGGQAHVARDARVLHGLAQLAADVVRIEPVAVHGRDGGDAHAAHRHAAAEARQHRSWRGCRHWP
jgi:hypothetical protein